MLLIQPQLYSTSETIYKDGIEIGELEYIEAQNNYKVTSITGLCTYAGTHETGIRYLVAIHSKRKTETNHPKLF